LDEKKWTGNQIIGGKYRYQQFIEITGWLGEEHMTSLKDLGMRVKSYEGEINVRTYPSNEFPNIAKELNRYSINKHNFGNCFNKDGTSQITPKLKSGVKRIFDDCRSNPDWKGCDIWGYFGERTFYKEECNNLIVIYTDGYPFHSDNLAISNSSFLWKTPWKKELHLLDLPDIKSKIMSNPDQYGLKTNTQGLSNLKVLVIGSQAKGKLNNHQGNLDYHERILIRELWRDWLVKMGVKEDNFDMLFMKDCDENAVRDRLPVFEKAFKKPLQTLNSKIKNRE
jgi:hypothetical protein